MQLIDDEYIIFIGTHSIEYFINLLVYWRKSKAIKYLMTHIKYLENS